LAQNEVSGQLHALAALPPVATDGGEGRPQKTGASYLNITALAG